MCIEVGRVFTGPRTVGPFSLTCYVNLVMDLQEASQ
jgi:hypothetical protein